MTVAGQQLPEKAADTTPEQPWPVRLLSMKIAEYVDRMSTLWVEGQVVQLNQRPGMRTAYLTLRDTDVDLSLSVALPISALEAVPTTLTQGAQVVIQAKPTFWTQRGQLLLQARQIRPIGLGELLARIEYLKATLAAEGLFDADRKRALPFLPRRVGLVTGRASAAEKDVVENARRRWPSVAFEIRQVAVQGVSAVSDVIAALRELDRIDEVDVIVIARGGGSVEDLLPFSNEALVRAVAAVHTPVVSAIGHDVDTPLLDFVADRRASTPTDAGMLVVPDGALERERIDRARHQLRGRLSELLTHERRRLVDLRTRPVLADPAGFIRVQRRGIDATKATLRRHIHLDLDRARTLLGHLTAQVRVLSPHQTLSRGYAIVRRGDGHVVHDPACLHPGELLRVTVVDGHFAVHVVGDDG